MEPDGRIADRADALRRHDGRDGLTLITVPRSLAIAGLLGVVWLASRWQGWQAGRVAAVAAMLCYLWAHGRPRFQSTVTDDLTIRVGGLLLVAGLVVALLGDRTSRHARRHGSTGP